MIGAYSFGKITIDNKDYQHDVQVITGTISKWRRAESHRFTRTELEEAISSGICQGEWPEAIIIGNGHDGVLNVDPEVVKAAKEKGIEVVVEKTGQAKNIYNKLENDGRRVLGLFHLTC